MNTQSKLQHKRKMQLGQGMTEYIIIVALIAIAGIAAFKLFGGTMQSQVGNVAQELAGGTGDEGRAQALATQAQDEGEELEDLGSFSGQNQ